MTVIYYMRSLQPTYGSEAHQRQFIAAMDRAEAANPCTKNHDDRELLASGREAPRCHTPSCYPTDTRGRMIGSWPR